MKTRPSPPAATKTAPPGAKPAAPAQPRPAPSNNDKWDEEEAWSHAPVAPRDENPLDSFGRSISEVVIGSEGSTKDKRKR